MSKRPIAILGAGNMASALALALGRQKRPIRLFCIEPDVETELNERHTNTRYLPGHVFPGHIRASAQMAEVVQDAAFVIVAVPSFAVREVVMAARPFLSNDVIVASISKGIDPITLEPVILLEQRLLPSALKRRAAVIGGPAVATEMANGSPTAFVVASRDPKSARAVAQLLHSQAIKVGLSSDLVGVGIASALKNVYAIALGMCDGLRFPTNAKSLVFTLAVEEMMRLVEKSGGKRESVLGLAGLGDLMVTGMSPYGRNRTYGERLVGAISRDPRQLGMGTVEGITATDSALRLMRLRKLDLPLLRSIGACLRAKHDFSKPFVRFVSRLRLH